MTSYFESIQVPTCMWFERTEKRNVLVSMLSGTLFFLGWWLLIDAHVKYPSEMANAYYVCGVLGTLSLLMVNSVTNAQIRENTYDSGCRGSRAAITWLFIGFVMGFAAVIAACWILFADFVVAGENHYWPGIGLFLQNVFIFSGSVIYKFGRSEDI